MKVKLKIWPNFKQIIFTSDFKNALCKNQIPGWHTGNIGYININGNPGYFFYFFLKIIH